MRSIISYYHYDRCITEILLEWLPSSSLHPFLFYLLYSSLLLAVVCNHWLWLTQWWMSSLSLSQSPSHPSHWPVPSPSPPPPPPLTPLLPPSLLIHPIQETLPSISYDALSSSLYDPLIIIYDSLSSIATHPQTTHSFFNFLFSVVLFVLCSFFSRASYSAWMCIVYYPFWNCFRYECISIHIRFMFPPYSKCNMHDAYIEADTTSILINDPPHLATIKYIERCSLL